MRPRSRPLLRKANGLVNKMTLFLLSIGTLVYLLGREAWRRHRNATVLTTAVAPNEDPDWLGEVPGLVTFTPEADVAFTDETAPIYDQAVNDNPALGELLIASEVEQWLREQS